MKQKNLQYISFVLVVALAFVLGYAIGKNSNEDQVSTRENTVFENVASISFDFGNGPEIAVHDIPVSENTNMFDVLSLAEEREEIVLESKDFGGDMGIFIESINGVGGDSDRWWQYWVNNRYSQTGVSSYQVQPGDIIRFEYTGGNFEL